jgi:hypothetical protein
MQMKQYSHIYDIMVRMKTTIELPDALLIRAKKRAAELRRPLRALVEEGLRARLARPDGTRTAKARKIRWILVDGGLPPDLDLADRTKMHDWIRGRR